MSTLHQPNILARGEHVAPKLDLLIILIVTLLLLFQRWILLKTSMRPFAYRMMGYSHSNELDRSAAHGVEKFCKYGWHFVAYIMLFCWGFMLLTESEWSVLKSGKLDNIWVGYPHSGEEKLGFKAFYIAQISWYAHGVVESLMVDRSRSDFYLMLLHHVLAIALLTGSFWGNAHRVGVTVCVNQVRQPNEHPCSTSHKVCIRGHQKKAISHRDGVTDAAPRLLPVQDVSDILMYFSKMVQKVSAHLTPSRSAA
jgi:hypothetical protein